MTENLRNAFETLGEILSKSHSISTHPRPSPLPMLKFQVLLSRYCCLALIGWSFGVRHTLRALTLNPNVVGGLGGLTEDMGSVDTNFLRRVSQSNERFFILREIEATYSHMAHNKIANSTTILKYIPLIIYFLFLTFPLPINNVIWELIVQ